MAGIISSMGSFKDPRLSTEECLKFAAECEEMAEESLMLKHRRHLLDLANMWRQLAAESLPGGRLQ
jgi:hypothetical protein